MIEYRCPACEALAYSSAPAGSSFGGCPSCGAQLEEVGAPGRPGERRHPHDFEPAPMNASVEAVRAAQGLRR
jgi:hypothetical protein